MGTARPMRHTQHADSATDACNEAGYEGKRAIILRIEHTPATSHTLFTSYPRPACRHNVRKERRRTNGWSGVSTKLRLVSAAQENMRPTNDICRRTRFLTQNRSSAWGVILLRLCHSPPWLFAGDSHSGLMPFLKMLYDSITRSPTFLRMVPSNITLSYGAPPMWKGSKGRLVARARRGVCPPTFRSMYSQIYSFYFELHPDLAVPNPSSKQCIEHILAPCAGRSGSGDRTRFWTELDRRSHRHKQVVITFSLPHLITFSRDL